MSFFSKAKDKLDNVSRSSSIRSKKSKEKKRLSGLRYESLNNSKESVNSVKSSGSKKKKEKVEPLAPVVGEPVPVKEAVPEAAPEAAPEVPVSVTEAPPPETSEPPVTALELAPETSEPPPASEPQPKSTTPEPQSLVPETLSSPKPSEPEPTETTPLNPNIDLESQRPISVLSSPRFSFFIIIVLLLLVAIVYFSYSDSNVVIKQSVKPSINSINLLELNNEGVKVHLNCSILINYDNITNIFHKFLYKNLSVLAGTIILIPKLPIEVQLNDLKSFNVTTPSQFSLGLTNHALTVFDFNSTIHLNDENLIKLLNSLMSEDEVLINLKTLFHTDLKKGWVSLKNLPISIDQELIFNNNLNGSGEALEVIDVEVDERLRFTSNVRLPKMVNDVIWKKNEFNIQIRDCQGDLVPIAEFQYFNGSIKGGVLLFPQDTCSLYDPLPVLYVNTTIVNDKYPSWLMNILNHVTFRIPQFQLPPITFPTVNYTLEETTIKNDKKLKMMNNISVDLPYDFDVHYDMSIAHGHVEYHEGTLINVMELDHQYNGQFEMNRLEVSSSIINATLTNLGNFSIPNITVPDPEIVINDIMVISSTSQTLDIFVDIDIAGIDLNFKRPMEFMLDAGKLMVGPVVTLSLDKSPELIGFLNNIISNRSQELVLVSPFNTITTTPKFDLEDLIVDVTMHVFGSEVELTVFNPISNHELGIMINSVNATYEGTKLGTIEKPHYVTVMPGESKTGKIPIKFNAVGVDILRKALNGKLLVDVISEFTMDIDELSMELVYEGYDLTANIRV